MTGVNLKHIKLCIVSLLMKLNKDSVVSVIIIMIPNSHCSFARHISHDINHVGYVDTLNSSLRADVYGYCILQFSTCLLLK